MKLKLPLITFTLLTTSTLFIACGSGEDSEGNTKSTESKIGYIIDSPIYGLNYECGDKEGLTEKDGKFSCDSFPVIFKVGDYTIGKISSITSDSKIFPQDLLGLDRSNVENPKLIELTQFLQALDDDQNITTAITINRETREKFKNEEGEDDNGESSLTPEKEALKNELPLPNPVSAMDHLRKSISPENYRPADTSDMSKYMGEWVGGGWGWEVRFKQNYGEFISQFSGVDLEDLPFKGEQNIMSLMVAHQTAFAFEVDENGYLQGTGTITYDLFPNLCGLNALTTNINKGVQYFDKIFQLSGMVTVQEAIDFTKLSVEYDSKVFFGAKASQQYDNAINAFIQKDWSKLLQLSVKEAYVDSKKTSDMCTMVNINSKIKGGLSIGPMSLDELLTNASLDVGKSVMDTILNLDVHAVTGFLLNVPGLTQIQYSYKGLQNGPESRTFSISGRIDENGKMYLNMDGLLNGGSNDLVVEYTVNYETERPTFPVWSPFLENQPGTIYPANREYIVYDYKDQNLQKNYNAYDSRTGDVTPATVTVSTPIIETSREKLEYPMATFKASGTKRNGVDVWHEYEYSWNAYRVEN